MMTLNLFLGVVVLLHVANAVQLREPVSKEPNGTIFIDVFVENNAEVNRVIAYSPNGITVQLEPPVTGDSVNDTLLKFMAKVLEVDKEKLTVHTTDGIHRLVKLTKSDLQVDDVMIKLNYEMHLR